MSQTLRRGAMALGWLLVIFLAAALLYGVFCAYTNFKCGTLNYARYTNALWNTAHGRPFIYNLTETYLAIHLSFSLGLLGLLFRFWDHPFLPMLAQWLFPVVGGALLARAARHQHLPGELVLSLLLFWFGHHFVQSVVLCEFHGVSAYLLLIPWLYLCLVNNRRFVWLPYVLILGLREEAGLMVIPLLLYFAVRHRWRAGYVYAGLALAYVALATSVIFPAITGASLWQQRAKVIGLSGSAGTTPDMWMARLIGLGWILAPVLLFFRRGWREILVIPSTAVLITLGSSSKAQVAMSCHYPAVILSCLAVAMAQAARRMNPAEQASGPMLRWMIPIYLALVTAFSYCVKGYLWGSQFSTRNATYRMINLPGLESLWVARHRVPSDGVLHVSLPLMGFAANRADLVRTPRLLLDARDEQGDIAFCRLGDIVDDTRNAVESGRWGARYFDDEHVVLERGYSTNRNAELLARVDTPTILFYRSAHDVGKNVFVPGEGVLRHWSAADQKGPRWIARRAAIRLDPGRYGAAFLFRTKPPSTDESDWGHLALIGEENTGLGQQAIEPSESRLLRSQTIEIHVARRQNVEPVVTSGRASIWLRRVAFHRLDDKDESDALQP